MGGGGTNHAVTLLQFSQKPRSMRSTQVNGKSRCCCCGYEVMPRGGRRRRKREKDGEGDFSGWRVPAWSRVELSKFRDAREQSGIARPGSDQLGPPLPQISSRHLLFHCALSEHLYPTPLSLMPTQHPPRAAPGGSLSLSPFFSIPTLSLFIILLPG